MVRKNTISPGRWSLGEDIDSEADRILMDKEEGLSEIMKQEDISQFIKGDVLVYDPAKPFDLVIALNPCLDSKDLTKHLSTRGYVIANNYHGNSSQLLENPEFEGVGTIDRNENGIYLARGDFSKLNEFVDYFCVFRKLGEES